MIWIQTFTGRAVDMLAPAPADIDFADVAHALALINRYDGHTTRPISVAQHCVMGADALLHETGSPRLAALFLLHDAHEAYLGDIVLPVQQALSAIEPECRYALREMRRRFDDAIHAGGIVGEASLVDCIGGSSSDWYVGPYGLVMAEARVTPFRPCKGALGFFLPDFDSRYAAPRAKRGRS